MKPRTNRRKNFLPALVLTLSLWTVLVIFIAFVSPQTEFAIPVFLSLVFFALFFAFSLLLGKAWKGLMFALMITVFLFLRLFGVGDIY